MSQLSAVSVAKTVPGGPGVLALQRKCACGNTAGLSGECEECGRKKMLGIQAKLVISEPGDQCEREADRIAEEVTRTHASSVYMHAGNHEPKTLGAQRRQPRPSRITPLMQRRSGDEERDDAGRTQLAIGTVAKPASAATELCLQRTRQSGGRPLDPATQASMESSFGVDFSKVRIHADSSAAAAARAIDARAFTIGQDVVFGAGQFAPQSQVGRRLLAHELVHVVQQGAGAASVVHRKKGEGDDVPKRIVRIVIRKDSRKIVLVGEQAEESISLKGDVGIFPEGQFTGEPSATGFRFTPPDGKQRTITLKSKGASRSLRRAIRSSKSFTVEVIDAAGNEPAGAGAQGGSALLPGGVQGADVEPVPPGTVEGDGPATQAGEGGEAPTPVEDEPDEERDVGEETVVDDSDARTFGVLITAPGGELSGDVTKAGQIDNFRENSRAEIRQRAQKAAASTLVSCFAIEPSAAEALASTRKIRIRLPRLGRLRKMAAESDASRKLPIAADLGALEGLLVDELGLSEGDTCKREENDCFFDGRLCLPRFNVEAESIEQKRDVETMIGAAEATVDAVEILMTLGALEAAEEGGEYLLKQWLREQRKKGVADRKKLREIEKAGKQLLREKEQIREGLARRPDTVQPSSMEGFDAEIKVGKHTYRRSPDGTWCRTTEKKCGISFDPELEKAIDDAYGKQREVLEEFAEHQDVPGTARSELPNRAKAGKGEPPGKVQGEAAEAIHAREVVGGHPLNYKDLPRAEKERLKEILWRGDPDALKKFARELPPTGASQVPLPTRFGKRIADHIFTDGEVAVVVLRESKKYGTFKLNAKLRRQLDKDIDAARRFRDVRVEWRISGKIDASTLEELNLLVKENPKIFGFVSD